MTEDLTHRWELESNKNTDCIYWETVEPYFSSPKRFVIQLERFSHCAFERFTHFVENSKNLIDKYIESVINNINLVKSTFLQNITIKLLGNSLPGSPNRALVVRVHPGPWITAICFGKFDGV